jgi:hypothetical protein
MRNKQTNKQTNKLEAQSLLNGAIFHLFARMPFTSLFPQIPSTRKSMVFLSSPFVPANNLSAIPTQNIPFLVDKNQNI